MFYFGEYSFFFLVLLCPYPYRKEFNKQIKFLIKSAEKEEIVIQVHIVTIGTVPKHLRQLCVWWDCGYIKKKPLQKERHTDAHSTGQNFSLSVVEDWL